jgi:putative addiction module killer protein
VVDFVKTQAYEDWLRSLDLQTQVRIVTRVTKFESTGHPGDAKPVGEGVMEMRLAFGPGYRVYYAVLKQTVILLGGNKSTQTKDIKTAKEFARYWKGQMR